MARPRLVLVQGACHQPWVWGPLTEHLEGWEVEPVDLPSSTPGVMGDLAADTAAVREALTRDERPVAVVAHSYGGVPVGEAVGGLTHVVRSFYLAVSMLPPGESVLSAAGGCPPYWERDEGSATFGAVDPERWFYGDVAPGLREQAVGHLRRQSTASFESRTSTSPHPVQPPVTYVLCTEDQAPPQVQEAMTAAAGCEEVLRFETSHSPMLSATAALARVVRERLDA